MSVIANKFYSFIHAPHSRERLRVTREMLLLLLTYHQVMPAFLDFVFPFGMNEHAQDFHFSQFRCEDTPGHQGLGLDIANLGRSGREIRLCYSLRSVEQSKDQRYWPWSIRQCAVYHSFDVDTSRSVWLIMKGNQLMKTRIMSTTEFQNPESPVSNLKGHNFAASLITHSLLADWSGENWRWYINHMENTLQETTRHALSVSVNSSSAPGPATTRVTFVPQERQALQHPRGEKPAVFELPLPPELPDFAEPSARDHEHNKEVDKEFSFEDLQKLQSLEEKANEANLVLGTNVGILRELKGQYESVISSSSQPSGDYPAFIKDECEREVVRFIRHLVSLENNMVLQRSRIETLMRLLADRKSLVGLRP